MLNDSTALSPESTGQAARILFTQARAGRARRVLLFAGERGWAVAQAQEALGAAGLEAAAGWLSDSPPAGSVAVAPSRISRLLGRELPALVVDAYAGFDPDAVGAAVGALAGGGLLLLITPPLAQWRAYPDPEHARIAVAPGGPEAVSGRFLGRLARVLQASPDVYRVEQGEPLPVLPAELPSPPQRLPGPYASDDQRAAVAAVLKVARGRRRRPLVLVADRGRGKSAAFGIAAAELLQGGPAQILVTGPRRDAVQAVFEHAVRLLPQAERQADVLRCGQAMLRFVAPDALVSGLPPADLLLVDEAAAIPLPLLGRLLRAYSRIAFATTVHGYEGTGRGFLLRFRETLDAQAPGWRLLRLEAPVRWAPGDPLERLGFRLLLLDAEAVPAAAVAAATPETVRTVQLDRDALAEDEPLLAELFGLLLQAHYRTRPFDLRHLLDGPNVQIYAQLQGRHVVGAALVALEGGLPEAIGEAVRRGERRLRGHLIPQSLAFHAGVAEGAQLRCARIMRLAVHPACRRLGLGSQLVEAVAAAATAEGVDLLGSSFGGNVPLLSFWQHCGLAPVRVGMTREASSGEHALMMLRALNAQGAELLEHAQRGFRRDLPAQLAEPLRGLEPALAARLLAAAGGDRALPDAVDAGQLEAFAFARRTYADTVGALRRLLLAAVSGDRPWQDLPAADRALLVAKILQGRDWSELGRNWGFSGQAEATEALRRAVAQLLDGLHRRSDPSGS